MKRYVYPIAHRLTIEYIDTFQISTSKSRNLTTIKKYLIEVKPKEANKSTQRNQDDRQKDISVKHMSMLKNQAKWKAAKEFCADRMWEFKVITEVELGIKK